MAWYLLIPVVAALLWWLAHQVDTDLPMLFFSKFGKSPKVLKGKVIWITGCSSGIGEQLALQLAKIGAKLAISGTRTDRLEDVKKRCLKLNSDLGANQVLVVPFDIADRTEHKKAIITVCQHFGRLDILVNNAGRYQVGHFEDSTDEEDLRTFQINLFGAIWLTRLAVKHWLARGISGHVVAVSSIAALMPSAMAANYAASKAAMMSYYESLRSELYYKNISVTIAVPGPVQTELFQHASTGEKGVKLSLKKPMMRFPFMTGHRAAELLTVAITNRVQEPWLVVPQILGFTYFAHYMPGLVRKIMPFVTTDRRLQQWSNMQF